MSKDGRNIGIRVRERKRVRGEGRELVTDTEGYLDGKEGMSEMFLAISQVFPVRERPCPTRTSLFMTSGIRVNAKVDAEEGKKPLFPNIPFSEPHFDSDFSSFTRGNRLYAVTNRNREMRSHRVK